MSALIKAVNDLNLPAFRKALDQGVSPHGDGTEGNLWGVASESRILIRYLGVESEASASWRAAILQAVQVLPANIHERQRSDEGAASALSQALEQEMVLTGLTARAQEKGVSLSDAAQGELKIMAAGARFLAQALKDRPENDTLPARTAEEQASADWLLATAIRCGEDRANSRLGCLEINEVGEVAQRYDQMPVTGFAESLARRRAGEPDVPSRARRSTLH